MANHFGAEIIQEMEDVAVPYFSVHVSTKQHRRRLDIPTKFIARTGFPASCDCTVVTGASSREWAVQFRTHGVADPKYSAFTVGDGYRQFVKDANVAYGSLLVVEAADDRCLVINIHRPPDETAKHVTPPPSPHTELRPHFQKTMRACHVRPFKSTRLDIPTPFWRSLGEDHFVGQWYTLQGPLQTLIVKSATYKSEKQTFKHFTKGWIDFVAVNHLKLGETLVFTKEGAQEFEVIRV